MAQAVAYSKTGAKQVAAVKLSPWVFSIEANHDLVNRAYTAYLANGRTNNAKTLERGEVRGGGKKPWKQKGTGRARAGGTRMPHWRGGGVAFGPTGKENFSVAMPLKAKRVAIRQALSLQAADKRILVIDEFVATEGRVAPTLKLIEKMKLEGNILIVVEQKNALIDRATRNIPAVKAVSAKYLNVYEIMNADNIVVTKKALDVIGEWLEATV